MASRESQGLQIALIIFVVIAIVLGVFTYIFYSNEQKALKDVASKTAEVDRMRATVDQQDKAYQVLLSTLGQSEFDETAIKPYRESLLSQSGPVPDKMKIVWANYERDMRKFDDSYTEARNYRNLPNYMESVLRIKQQKITETDTKLRELKQEADKAAEQYRVALKAKDDELKAAAAARAQLSAAYDTSVADIRSTKQKLADQIASVQGTLKSTSDAAKKMQSSLETRVQTLTRDNKDLVRERNRLTETPVQQTPDGMVTFVNQRGRSVWINRGDADGLQRGVTFSVLDKNTTSVEGAKPKGSIEITRIVEPHLAEANILSDDISNPILDGDLIYSPSWQPGAKIHFALVGFMDYNGDGKDDSALVRNAITLNNGVIDAQATATGRKTGTMTVTTRYLVVGNRPNDKSDPEALKQYSLMIDRAEKLGIEQISVSKLLNSMGVKTTTRTVGLGRGGDTTGGEGNSGFRPRKPPARGDGGAF